MAKVEKKIASWIATVIGLKKAACKVKVAVGYEPFFNRKFRGRGENTRH